MKITFSNITYVLAFLLSMIFFTGLIAIETVLGVALSIHKEAFIADASYLYAIIAVVAIWYLFAKDIRHLELRRLDPATFFKYPLRFVGGFLLFLVLLEIISFGIENYYLIHG